MRLLQNLAAVRRRPVLLTAAALLASGLCLLSLACLARVATLQGRLDDAVVSARLSEALGHLLQQDQQPVIQRRVRQLLDLPELGLEYLEVADLSGVVFAGNGRLDHLRLPFVSDTINRALRHGLYRLTARAGRFAILNEGRPVGRVDYAANLPQTAQIRDAALRSLQAAGLAGLILGLPLAVLLSALAWRRWSGAPARRRAQATAEDRALRTESANEATQLLDKARQRFGSTLDSMGVALITCGRDARVRFINQTAETLTGWPGSAAMGQLVYSVFHVMDESGAPRLSAAEQSLREGGEVLRQRCRLRARDGAEAMIDMMAAPLKDVEGLPDGVVMLFGDISDRMAELEELRRQSRLSLGVIDHLDEGVITTDRAGVLRFANARALQLFGYSREEIDGFTVSKLMPVPFLNTPEIRLHDYIAATPSEPSQRLPRVVGWRKDATTFPVELEVQPMYVGEDSGLILIVRDISERLRGENLAQRLGRLLDAAVEEIYIFDDTHHRFLEVNRGACRNLGYSQEQMLGMTSLDISEGLEAETFSGYLAALRAGTREQVIYQCRHRHADGSDYPVEVRLSYSHQENPPVFMAIASDISDRIMAEDQLRRLAHQDALTGLPNRRVLHDRIRLAIRNAMLRGRPFALLYLDLDHFKQINDSFGHEVGDQVLRMTAERLQAALRVSDMVARLGGDEFAVLAAEVRGAEDAGPIAQKLLDVFATPLEWQGRQHAVTPSVGIAIYPDHAADAESLLRCADAAMYQAKQAGRACFRLYSPPAAPVG